MSFISTISKSDLDVLRRIVRKVHLAYVPDDFKPDRECDKLIEGFGLEVVDMMLRFGVDKGLR